MLLKACLASAGILAGMLFLACLPLPASADNCDPYWYQQTGYCLVPPVNPTWTSNSTSVTISWSMNLNGTEPNLTRIYRGSTQLKDFPVSAFEDPNNVDHFDDVFTFTDSPLHPSTPYGYRVCSVYGYTEECTPTFSATTKVGQVGGGGGGNGPIPTNVQAVLRSPWEILLSWQNGSGTNGLDVARFKNGNLTQIDKEWCTTGATGCSGTVAPTATSFDDATVQPASRYQYEISAYAGQSAWSPVVLTSPPPQPTVWRATGTVKSANEILLSWQNANGVNGLDVARYKNGNLTQIDKEWCTTGATGCSSTVAPTATSFDDTTVQPRTSYKYKISAYGGQSTAWTPTFYTPNAPRPKVSVPLASGFAIQSTYGIQGNFEMVVSEGARLVHYWRDNDAPGYPWHEGSDIIGMPSLNSTDRWTAQGANLFLGLNSSVEVMAWVHHYGGGGSLINGGGPASPYDNVEHFWLDNGKWMGPDLLTTDGQAITPTATPAVLKGLSGKLGNFEMVVPEGARLVHYWRDNDAPGYPWHKGSDIIAAPSLTSPDRWTALGANLFLGLNSSLEVMAWVHHYSGGGSLINGGGPAAPYDNVEHFWLNNQKWMGPDLLTADGQAITPTATPAVLKGPFGKIGNFEMVVPEGARLVHYWRDNDAPGYPWHKGSDIIAAPSLSSTDRWTVQGATLFQSNVGDLEVVAWVHHTPLVGPNLGAAVPFDELRHYRFDGSAMRWTGPDLIPFDGKQITGQ
jgi:hypothetical protein